MNSKAWNCLYIKKQKLLKNHHFLVFLMFCIFWCICKLHIEYVLFIRVSSELNLVFTRYFQFNLDFFEIRFFPFKHVANNCSCSLINAAQSRHFWTKIGDFFSWISATSFIPYMKHVLSVRILLPFVLFMKLLDNWEHTAP